MKRLTVLLIAFLFSFGAFALAEEPSGSAIAVTEQILLDALETAWNEADVQRTAEAFGMEVSSVESPVSGSMLTHYRWRDQVALTVRSDDGGKITAANICLSGRQALTPDGEAVLTNEEPLRYLCWLMDEWSKDAGTEEPLPMMFPVYRAWAVRGITVMVRLSDDGTPYFDGDVWLVIEKRFEE